MPFLSPSLQLSDIYYLSEICPFTAQLSNSRWEKRVAEQNVDSLFDVTEMIICCLEQRADQAAASGVASDLRTLFDLIFASQAAFSLQVASAGWSLKEHLQTLKGRK